MYYKFISIVLILFVAQFQFLFSIDTLNIDKNKLKESVKYLSSNELKGRFPGTEGIELAAQFIENEFSNIGLKKFNNSYRQAFKITTSMNYHNQDNNTFSVTTIVQRIGVPKEKLPKVSQPFKLEKDFSPLVFSKNDKVKGELAFVGFGISDKANNYDDYEGIDVKDKIVIILSDSPDGENKESKFFHQSDLRHKANVARSKGAIGMILVKIQGDSMNVFESLNESNIGGHSGIVAVQCQRQSISKYFPKDKILYEIEDKIIKTKKPNSFLIPNIEIEMSVDLVPEKSDTYNIYGYIEGTDPKLKNEYIVIGAHYDHLGFGNVPTARKKTKKANIYNGADDNASGVVGLLELARHYQLYPSKRSIIFCSFSSEEMGLLGSAHFVKNLPVPKESIITMINFDMIGRLENELTVFGYSSAKNFEKIIDSVNQLTSLKIAKASDAYGPSDHSSFYSEKIPVMMIFTGVHDDYHTPDDDWNKINYDGMISVLNYSEKIITTIADNPDKPEYVESLTSERRSSHGGSYSKVWFGIIPSFGESSGGCKIGGSSPGSPASKAGLQKDDIITKLNNKNVDNLNEFTNLLKEFNPGDVVKVIFLRNGKEMQVDVTLTSKN